MSTPTTKRLMEYTDAKGLRIAERMILCRKRDGDRENEYQRRLAMMRWNDKSGM